MNAVILLPDQTIIKRKRLAELERIERAHDVYLRAMKRMRARMAEVQNTLDEMAPLTSLIEPARRFRTGFIASMQTFAELVAEEDRNE